METAEGSLGCRIRVVQRGFYFAPIFFRDKGDFCLLYTSVAFYRNGVIGKNKKEVRARLMREKEEEKLKRQLLDEYLKAHNDTKI